MKEKVFITGATGFIGSNLVRDLVKENNHEVHIIYRNIASLTHIKDLLPSIHIHKIDLKYSKKLASLMHRISPHYIFHLANIGVYGGVESDPESVINVNFMGTLNLLNSSRDVPYKVFVNTGSSSEYGSRNTIMNENDRCEPQGIYAISKLASTLLALDYAREENKPILNFRIFSPFGPHDNKSRLIPYIINQLINNKTIELDKKDSVRDYIYIDDVVRAYKSTMNLSTLAPGEIINIGSGIERSVLDVVTELKKITKLNTQVSWNNVVNRHESVHWQADIKRAYSLLAWKPNVTFKDGLNNTFNWYKEDAK